MNDPSRIHGARIHYPPELPVSERRDDIARAIREHQVVIVAGATGSGKTTQLPKICLELGRTSIGHTQPRRLAARTIAERIAEELGDSVGGLVGYQVRFTDRVSETTRIKLMTDGILLNELHRDRMLRRYDTVIIDEAHERSLNVDFLLGYLKQLLPRRPDLKVVITSATIDPESFAAHFADAHGNPAPIIEVSGRTYPVEIRYRPLVADSAVESSDGFDDEGPPTEIQETHPKKATRSQKSGRPAGDFLNFRSDGSEPHRPGTPGDGDDAGDLFEAILSALDELSREAPGDVLVFLSGENEIRDAQEAILASLTTRGTNDTEVLPLFGRLSAADQHRVFESRPSRIRRRIVLATNVAETSLTVPGIKYVIDAGTARISRYSARSKIQRLPIEAISQASANQRSGRAGRTSEGIAIRLYSEDDFAKRPEFTDPEILRTNLAAVILQMMTLGLGDIREFPFLQPPDARGVKDGLELLRELGAVRPTGSAKESTREAETSPGSRPCPETRAPRTSAPGHDSAAAGAFTITEVGRRLVQLPVDPRLGRMLLESKRHGVTREVMAIVAGLSIQDPRERPLEKRAQADQLHARFTDKTSDFLTLLNLWNHLKKTEKELSGNQFRRRCKAEYLNYLRIREWSDVYRQLARMAKPLGLTVGPPSTDADGIHRSLMAGLLSQLGMRDETTKDKARRARGDYIGARQTRFSIFPGSALAKKQPREVMSAELVETSRLFARMNAVVDLAWAEPIAGDLTKRQLGEPHWEKRQGAAVAFERVTLYGLPIVARRRVQLARFDRALARELFIRHALVDGDADFSRLSTALTDFLRRNAALRTELEEEEERTRRRDLLADDEHIVEFYDERIPGEVFDQRSFEAWWRKTQAKSPELLQLTRSDLIDEEPAEEPLGAGFPDTWVQGDQSFAVKYRFEPGHPDDGLSVIVPLALLPRLEPRGFDWLVPGMREELVSALIKALPKPIRRHVVPAADWAARLLDDPELADGAAHLLDAPIGEWLAARVRRLAHTPMSAGDIEWERVPDHLKAGFVVVDEQGGRRGAGKDLAELQGALKPETRTAVAAAHRVTGSGKRRPHPVERTGLTTWDLDELPRVLDTDAGPGTVRAYPALVDEGSSVEVRLLHTPKDQLHSHRAGVLRLLLLAVPSPASYVLDHLTQAEKLALSRSPYRSAAELIEDAVRAVAAGVLDELPWDRASFERARDTLSEGLMDAVFDTVNKAAESLKLAREVEKAVSAASSMALIAPLGDVTAQLAGLVHPGFVSRAGRQWLGRYPVYLEGARHRIGRLAENVGRDRVWLNEVREATERYRAAGGELPLQPDAEPRLVTARWHLEEMRLSLFAQHLPTAVPVSLARITKLLA